MGDRAGGEDQAGPGAGQSAQVSGLLREILLSPWASFSLPVHGGTPGLF